MSRWRGLVTWGRDKRHDWPRLSAAARPCGPPRPRPRHRDPARAGLAGGCPGVSVLARQGGEGGVCAQTNVQSTMLETSPSFDRWSTVHWSNVTIPPSYSAACCRARRRHPSQPCGPRGFAPQHPGPGPRLTGPARTGGGREGGWGGVATFHSESVMVHLRARRRELQPSADTATSALGPAPANRHAARPRERRRVGGTWRET